MATIGAATYERAIAAGCEAVADAVDRSPSIPVPNCPGWEVADLARHLGSLYTRVAEQVRRRSPEPLGPADLPVAPEGPVLGRWLRESAGRLLATLKGADDDAPAGPWRGRAVPAGFWRRRMAHETVVHWVDAAGAVGDVVAVDGDLAADGVTEALQLYLPFSVHTERWPPGGPLWLARTDGTEQWWAEPGQDRVETLCWPPGPLPPAERPLSRVGRVEATAPELFLVCWGRLRPPVGAVTARPDVVDEWLSVLGW